MRRAARALAPLAAEHELMICHGNGPQIGLLALESESDPELSRPYPLDVLVAQTQGMIGYWLAQELRNAGVAHPIVTVPTQTVVDSADPGFTHPTKFIGAVYTEHQARRLARRHGWHIAPDGEHWRRVVASPQPLAVLETAAIRTLMTMHAVVICGGGGGVAVIDSGGQYVGVEAVVDKDLVAAMIAEEFRADRLVILTDVAAVMRDYGTPAQAAIGHLSIAELSAFDFAAGSMGPKIEACRRFVTATGHPAYIGRLEDADRLLTGTVGTTITVTPEPAPAAQSHPAEPHTITFTARVN